MKCVPQQALQICQCPPWEKNSQCPPLCAKELLQSSLSLPKPSQPRLGVSNKQEKGNQAQQALATMAKRSQLAPCFQLKHTTCKLSIESNPANGILQSAASSCTLEKARETFALALTAPQIFPVGTMINDLTLIIFLNPDFFFFFVWHLFTVSINTNTYKTWFTVWLLGGQAGLKYINYGHLVNEWHDGHEVLFTIGMSLHIKLVA